MKKIVSVLIFLPAFVIGYAVQAQIIEGDLFVRDLYYGLTNDMGVALLQQFLVEEGVYSGPITGNFLFMTDEGVKNFQARENIPATGFFGPLSRARANEIVRDNVALPDIEPLKDFVASVTPESILQPELREPDRGRRSINIRTNTGGRSESRTEVYFNDLRVNFSIESDSRNATLVVDGDNFDNLEFVIDGREYNIPRSRGRTVFNIPNLESNKDYEYSLIVHKGGSYSVATGSFTTR